MKKPNPTNKELILSDNEIIVSKTDTKGKITYGNDKFIEYSGYEEGELLFKPHNILRHPDMPKAIFKLLWETIQKKQELNAYVKNLTKDGSFYWVWTNITPSFDKDNKIIGYFSVRRTPNKNSLEKIKLLYKEMLRIEGSSGMEASYNHLMSAVKKEGVSYEEFILSF